MSLMREMESTKVARSAWNNDKVISRKDLTFGGVINTWQILHKICLKAKERLSEEIEDTKATCSQSIIDERIPVLMADYAQLMDKHRAKYSDYVNSVCDDKVSELDHTVSKTPDANLIALIQPLTLRKEVSDREWQAIVFRVNEAHDYQAARLLSDVAEKFGRSYAVPFDPDKKIEEIEGIRADLLRIAKSLDTDDKDLDLMTMNIVGDYARPTKVQEYFNQLDTAAGVAVPEKKLSMIERLKEASQIARENGDHTTANAINRFIYERATLIDDRQEISSFYKEQAESLISKALSSRIV